VALVEKRNRRAESLAAAAGRILNGIASRVASMESPQQIAAYFAGDLMVEKVRDLIGQLQELDDAVRVGDLQSRLKSIREDATRTLKDRTDLYEAGGDVIRLGKHRFAVNTQPIDLTTVLRDGQYMLHLTGTQFFEPLRHESLDRSRDLWDQPLISENEQVYRAEYLAMDLFNRLLSPENTLIMPPEVTAGWVNAQMSGRFDEGYAKGVHDADAAMILRAMLGFHNSIGLLRYEPTLRAAGRLVWSRLIPEDQRAALENWINGFAKLARAFPDAKPAVDFRARLGESIDRTADRWRDLFGSKVTDERMAEYLFYQLTEHAGKPVVSGRAASLLEQFQTSLPQSDREKWLVGGLKAVGDCPERSFVLARNWADAFLERTDETATEAADPPQGYRDELAQLILDECERNRRGRGKRPAKADGPDTSVGAQSQAYHLIDRPVATILDGMAGTHRRIRSGKMSLHFHEFLGRLRHHHDDLVPRFRLLHQAKSELIDQARQSMRLDEFRPRVLSSFVRNQLLDEVYLPIIGDNLAKQMGSAGEDKRTDRMGLLLLISPPGYGKTTLMEYIANRLGLVFMKINGPAIGHGVTSLDPAEAPNAAAREEVQRLNLALEMGDNVMLYLDDIQHTHPELLQKFISLCDATRKIEGVRNGETRTYDLRGRRVAVVMAGNPYTESGARFQIPDMLANRADVYNLGEIIGDKADAFEMSYLENCLTSNPVLAPLSTASPEDARALMRAADRGSLEGLELQANLPLDEVRDMFEVARRLLRVRDIVLQVNRTYIRSAAQADAYRTEPPFKLQGSYRNMNRLAERVAPVMNDAELQSLIVSNYEQDAQTLTSDNEANLLKFKELLGILTPEEQQRWDAIKYAYVESVRMSGMDDADQVGQVMRQLASMRDGLESIRQVIAKAIAVEDHAAEDRMDARADALRQSLLAISDQLASRLESTGHRLEEIATQQAASPPEQKVLVQHKVPRVMAELIKGQFHLMQEWMRPLLSESLDNSRDLDHLKQQLETMMRTYGRVEEAMKGEQAEES